MPWLLQSHAARNVQSPRVGGGNNVRDLSIIVAGADLNYDRSSEIDHEVVP